MSDLHERARELLLASLAEGLDEADGRWLETHLAECAGCERLREDLGAGLRAVRLTGVSVDPALLAATQQRLRIRAQELGYGRWPWGLMTSTATSVALAALTGAGLWVTLGRLGERAGLSLPFAAALAVTLWLLPASMVGLAVVLLAPRPVRERLATLSEVHT